MQPRFRHLSLVTALTASALATAAGVHASTASEIYQRAARSTVVVQNLNAKAEISAFGSGVVLPTGEVATNCHVVKDASALQVRSGDHTYPAQLRRTDWDRDVCSLSVAGLRAPAVVMGSTRSLAVGAKVYAIGASRGLELTLSDGLVSSLREVEGGHYIQTTAAISPGSSGGGLYDDNGALVGLTTFYVADGQNLNFAVPVEWVQELAQRSASAAPGTTANSTTAIAQTEWLNKAIALESRQDWPALLEHGRRWTRAQPNNATAWYSLGSAYAHARQSAQAIAAYQQALRIDPQLAAAWYNLGVVHVHAGQSAQAIVAFQQALRIDPRDANALFNLGIAYYKSGQRDQVLEVFQQLKTLDPARAETFFTKIVMP
ncbi:MAG: trypsin-like peptidase domain-containing protein [Porticoccaceae bacterium]